MTDSDYLKNVLDNVELIEAPKCPDCSMHGLCGHHENIAEQLNREID